MRIKIKITIQDMHDLAKKRGGKCLSEEYIGTKSKLKWQCSKGHTWHAVPYTIKKGSWCPKCANVKGNIEEMHTLAKKRGGKCLSTKYVNFSTKLKWKCARGHTWKAKPYEIKEGKWCLKCYHLDQRLTIEEMHTLAKKRGGKCLSTKYVNTDTKLKWQCSEGHTWYAIPSSIKQGSWCAKCRLSLGEEICRTTFEALFAKKFRKIKPVWLKGDKGFRLELDGYNRELNMAFEYHGAQHFKPTSFGLRSKDKVIEKFTTQKERDNLKKKLCKKNNVSLFIITHLDDLKKLPHIIKNKCKSLKINIDTINFNKEINFDNVYKIKKHKLQIYQKIAKERGGKCLSTNYVNTSTKLKWQCSEGHIWEVRPDMVRRGSWCAKCATNKQRGTIEEMHTLAKERGGKCLSTNYVNTKSKLKWQCSEGHTWYAEPNNIKQGTWCPICSRKLQMSRRDSQTGRFKNK